MPQTDDRGHGKSVFGPQVRRLRRRDLIKLGIAAGGLTAGGVVLTTWLGGNRTEQAAVPPGYKKRLLPPVPFPNPAFVPQPLSGGGLLLWTRLKNGTLLAYSLSPAGRAVWALCDGKRSRGPITDEYARGTGRASKEASGFLAELIGKSVLMEGGYVVAPDCVPETPFFSLVSGEVSPPAGSV